MPTLPPSLNIMSANLGPRGKRVPNVVPANVWTPYRLAIVGEAPGAEEDRDGVPFSGPSGRFLNALLSATGIVRSACFVGNVCQYRPPNNDLASWGWDCDEVQSGLEMLKQDLDRFQPNLVLALGRYALRALAGDDRSVFTWRGSLFRGASHGPASGRKCLASLHPAYVLRDYSAAPLLRFDLARARKQAESATLSLPERHFEVDLTAHQIVSRLDSIARDGRVHLSFDLEGYWNRITRYSVALSPWEGFIVPFTQGDYGSAWSADEEAAIWRATSRTCSDPRIPKVLQNSLYDRFVLAYKHRILLTNVVHDTMLGHWEMYAELEKNLGLQASIYTLEPHWKEDREDDDLRTRMIYCCKDSAVTEEIRQAQLVDLATDADSSRHFGFNMSMLNPLLYMELRGILYDKTKALSALTEVTSKCFSKMRALNLKANKAFTGTTQELLTLARDRLCKKREAAFVTTFAQLPAAALKAEHAAAVRMAALASEGRLAGTVDAATLGEVESLLAIGLNVESNKQMVSYLYDQCGYERQWKVDKRSGKESLTADVGACLTLFKKYRDDTLKLVLSIRSDLYQIETLGIQTDPDGRIRCGYNIVGTETGRLSCYESPTGSGYNLQTVTKKLRYLFVSDPGYELFQCDLAGADGWTVAAHCARLGDPTMLLDYQAGLKPARIIALMYGGVVVKPSDERAGLKLACKSVDSDGWLYFACKRVQHGTNYGMGVNTMATQIMKDSHKLTGDPVYVEPAICRRLQDLYLARYPGIALWHRWVEQQLLAHGSLRAASGRMRRFFGRMRDADGRLNHETLKAALSNEPQDNTTYATNLAALRLWSDPDNRRPDGSLIIEPLHQVHDALIGQWPIDRRQWAVGKLRDYFNNSLTIAGQSIVIPFEGAYGPSWGQLDSGVI